MEMVLLSTHNMFWFRNMKNYFPLSNLIRRPADQVDTLDVCSKIWQTFSKILNACVNMKNFTCIHA